MNDESDLPKLQSINLGVNALSGDYPESAERNSLIMNSLND